MQASAALLTLLCCSCKLAFKICPAGPVCAIPQKHRFTSGWVHFWHRLQMAVRTCFMPDYEVLGDFVRGSVSWEVPCPLWPTVCSVGRALLRRSPRGGTGMHDLLSLLTHTQQCEKSTVLTLSFSCRDKGLFVVVNICSHLLSKPVVECSLVPISWFLGCFCLQERAFMERITQLSIMIKTYCHLFCLQVSLIRLPLIPSGRNIFSF